MKGQEPPAPTRKQIGAGGKTEDDDEDEDEEKDEDGGDAPVEDLVPRNDIGFVFYLI